MRRIFGFLFVVVVLISCAPKALYLLDVHEPVIPPDTPQRPWIMVGSRKWGSSKLFRKLCLKGELRLILRQAHLSPEAQRRLFEAACGPERSTAAFVRAYYGLPEDKRIDLREVLENHGYILNEFPC
ncbi:hypothetical protein [Thermosulfurimonas sp. F29]|uniref:hypothetical protein n=1 Tax=Thermosulfurimonas sp. F29 TaxID=2867247 RepID=UPI001C83F2A0|nr:hypothetical protein [Thermosulfurimonas sp. F29]MBX6422354.1 hypothetical protein [Thermosulfurimonas sp. F29]